jgi:hypothetical protein
MGEQEQAAGGHGLSVQYARTEPRKYSFAVRTVEKWNNLPDNIKSALNGEVFRNRMAKNSLPGNIKSAANGEVFRNRMDKNNPPDNIKSAPNGEVFRNRMANLYAKFSDIQ